MNSSHNRDTTATRGGASSVPTPANTVSGIFTSPSSAKKGSSSGQSGQGEGMFSSLSSVKRDSGNEEQTARRASLSEQSSKPGMLGQMWQKYVEFCDSRGHQDIDLHQLHQGLLRDDPIRARLEAHSALRSDGTVIFVRDSGAVCGD